MSQTCLTNLLAGQMNQGYNAQKDKEKMQFGHVYMVVRYKRGNAAIIMQAYRLGSVKYIDGFNCPSKKSK